MQAIANPKTMESQANLNQIIKLVFLDFEALKGSEFMSFIAAAVLRPARS